MAFVAVGVARAIYVANAMVFSEDDDDEDKLVDDLLPITGSSSIYEVWVAAVVADLAISLWFDGEEA